MVLSFKCENMMKDCKWSTTAKSVHELMQKINTHVEIKHDIKEISEVQKNKIKAYIKTC